MALLRARPLFARLVLAQLVSVFGDKFTNVAMATLALMLGEGRALPVAVTLLASYAPPAVLGMIAGPLVDRWHRGRTMLACDLFRAVVVACAFFADSLTQLYVLSLLLGVGTTLFTPAQQATIPATVEKEELNTANSFANSAEAAVWMAGPALAVVVTSLTDVRVAFLVDAATYLLSALLILPLARTIPAPQATRPERQDLLEDIREGLRYHRENPVVFNLLVLQTLLVLGAFGFNAIQVKIVQGHFGLAPNQVGLLSAVMAAGLTAGYMVIAHLGARIDRRRVIGWSYACAGAATVAVAAAPNMWLALPLFFAMGFFNAGFSGTQPAWIQEVTPSHLLGRVFALRYVCIQLAAMVGMPTAGWLTDHVGLLPTVQLLGMVIMACGALTFALPGLRYASRPAAA